MKSPEPVMLSAIAYHDAEICYGLCGKKEPSTTVEQRAVVRCCRTQLGATFQRIWLLCHLSKVLKFILGLDVCKVVQRKLDQMQSALVATTNILVAGVKYCGEEYLLCPCKGLLLLDE